MRRKAAFVISRLIDRLPTQRASWPYALRIALITAAFHAGCLLIVSIVVVSVPYLRGFYLWEYRILVPALIKQYGLAIPVGALINAGFVTLAYWAVFILAALSDETNPMHRWRVRLSWLLVTFPFAAIYLLSVFDIDEFAGFALYVFFKHYTLPLIALSPIVTFLGAVVGHFLWRLFQWLRRVQHSTDTMDPR